MIADTNTSASAERSELRGQLASVPRRCRPQQVPLLGPLLFRLYALPLSRVRQAIRWLLDRLEGGSAVSVTLRRVFARYHGVEVGLYTHGGWVIPYSMDQGTRIGRYSSIAATARTLTHNHPMNTRSTSPLFFNPHFGLVDRETVPWTALTIGNDVWIGHNAIILPSVTSIGDGAVIGAGAVVHKNVPPFAVVTGHPSRVVRYRFSESVIQEMLASRWWDKSPEDLQPELASFLKPIEEHEVR